jgi:AraC-like DNA-binding protein
MERQALHRHANARLILFIAGSQSEETPDSTHMFAACDVLFRPSYFAHANATGVTGAVYVHVELSAAASKAWLRQYGWSAGFARTPFTLARLKALARRPHFSDALLETVTARPTQSLPVEKRAVAEAERGSVAEASRKLGLPPYALSRAFRRRHGCAPRTYRNMVRLHRALRMIFEGAHSLSEIAQACDYFDQSHLSRSVKAETGMSPGALSKAMRV